MQSIELHQCSSTSLKNGICRTESRESSGPKLYFSEYAVPSSLLHLG